MYTQIIVSGPVVDTEYIDKGLALRMDGTNVTLIPVNITEAELLVLADCLKALITA